tara:strand:- start:8995 stop:9522 length:528 start_codon:yes stop_codon:yes gene_type:complete
MNENCSICLCEINNKTIINCGHYFCSECIDSWINNNKEDCPLCRTRINEYNNNNGKTKIIYSSTNVQEDIGEDQMIVNIRDINIYKLRYYLLWVAALYELYLIINKSYVNGQLQLSLENCNNQISNITNNYDQCMDYLNDITLRSTYVYDMDNEELILCDFPLYYIKKCFNFFNI